MNRYLLTIWCTLVFLSGCAETKKKNNAQTVSEPNGAIKAKQANEKVIAQVNGQAVKREHLVSVLLRGRGKWLLEELIISEAVRQEAAKKNIHPTDTLIAAQLKRILDDMAPEKSRREQLALLDYMLKSRQMTRPEFDLIVERQALLRELVGKKTDVTEQMLRREYERQHGRQVEVRQLIVSNIRKIEQVQKRLASGESFAEIVQNVSEDEQSLLQGGLSGLISASDENIPEPLRVAALKLQTTGQRSEPFQYRDKTGRQWWQLLQLERVMPADGVAFDSVRDELADAIQERQTRQRMGELARSLRKNARVKIIDPMFK